MHCTELCCVIALELALDLFLMGGNRKREHSINNLIMPCIIFQWECSGLGICLLKQSLFPCGKLPPCRNQHKRSTQHTNGIHRIFSHTGREFPGSVVQLLALHSSHSSCSLFYSLQQTHNLSPSLAVFSQTSWENSNSDMVIWTCPGAYPPARSFSQLCSASFSLRPREGTLAQASASTSSPVTFCLPPSSLSRTL